MEERSLRAELEQIDRRLKKIERHMLFSTISTVLKFIFIVAPIILAIIYIPPFVKGLMPQINQAQGIWGQVSGLMKQLPSGDAR